MRIIAGKLGGRNFGSPKDEKTHPMSEKIRGALFNALGDIEGLSVLDACAGSGAISFEAISRGAEFVQMIDNSRQAIDSIEKSIQELGIEDTTKLTQANCASWSDNSLEQKFDLIFCDPPFDKLNTGHLEKLSRHLKQNGLMVLSFIGRRSAPTVNGVVVVDSRLHGDAALAFYRQEA